MRSPDTVNVKKSNCSEEAKEMAPSQLISADSHFVEPPKMWAERIDQKFRDRAPHTEKNLKGRDGEFFVCENITPIPVAGFFGSGKTSEQLPEHFRHGFDAAPKAFGTRRSDSKSRIETALTQKRSTLLWGCYCTGSTTPS
jgi:hypothetical protein